MVWFFFVDLNWCEFYMGELLGDGFVHDEDLISGERPAIIQAIGVP